MNIYSMSSGDNDPSNDYVRMHVAMDAGTSSNIRIYNSGIFGVIQYSSTSDYAWKVERVKYISEETVELSTSENQKIGYPSGFAWIPGDSISSLSSSEEVETGKLDSLTEKSELSNNEYLKSGSLVLEDLYDDEWSPQGIMKVSNVYSLKGNMPFVNIKNKEISSTGSFDIYASSLEGCIFTMDIKRDFISGDSNGPGSLLLPDLIKTKTTSSVSKGETLKEWNSMFEINQNSNVDSIFKNGQNRDEVFIQEMQNYLEKNWYNKLKRNLWGNYIDNESIQLSSRDPETLKNHIFYCFYYFGASDDINILSNTSFSGSEGMNWYIGLGGKSLFSENVRALRSELAYLPVVKQTKEITKIYASPPRTTYSYNLQNNINIADFID